MGLNWPNLGASWRYHQNEETDPSPQPSPLRKGRGRAMRTVVPSRCACSICAVKFWLEKVSGRSLWCSSAWGRHNKPMKWILGNSLTRYGLIIAAGVGLTLCLFPNIVHGLFRSDEFMPHATCYLRNPQMILLHVSSDLVIGISYVCISTTLGYLVWKASRDIPFHWMFLAFGLFIVTCGFTHFMEVWTVWKPVYWLAGYVKL